MAYINGKQLFNVNYTGIVDEKYNPDSKNAQSGIAVAEAVAGVGGESNKTYELINTITVAPDTDGALPKWVIFNKDKDGNSFELDSFYVIANAGYTDGTSSTLYVKVNDAYCVQNVSGVFKNTLTGSVIAFRHQNDGFIEFSVTNGINNYWGWDANMFLSKQLHITPDRNGLYPITNVHLGTLTGTNKTWIEDSKFELWGVRK